MEGASISTTKSMITKDFIAPLMTFVNKFWLPFHLNVDSLYLHISWAQKAPYWREKGTFCAKNRFIPVATLPEVKVASLGHTSPLLVPV